MPALRAVLFDLDGTLLDNDLDVFLPRYFERLSARVSRILPQREFVARLVAATQVMVQNDGRATNEEVFAGAFYPLAGHAREEVEPIFLDFYRREYPSLQEYTRCRPEARRAVQAAFDLGYQVVIATNPLFPAIANQERLAWAGVAGFPYALVTSYENSRACKPNPAYYRGIVEALGCPAEACLMVGNEPGDLQAGLLGCPTYLVSDGNGVAELSPAQATYHGTLGDLPALLAAQRASR